MENEKYCSCISATLGLKKSNILKLEIKERLSFQYTLFDSWPRLDEFVPYLMILLISRFLFLSMGHDAHEV